MKEKLTYHREGDYLLPDLIPPNDPQIGIWGLRRKNFLLKYKKSVHTAMLLNGMLKEHLEEIDSLASEMFSRLAAEMTARESITETLKASEQMIWVGEMNNIRNRAEELVLRELIYA